VLYELGIAHTLAKPVLIISRNADDIPIDLSTRRVILYGQAGDWIVDLESKVTRGIKEILTVYRMSPVQLPGLTPPAAADFAQPDARLEVEKL
jgi:hypothetical protein